MNRKNKKIGFENYTTKLFPYLKHKTKRNIKDIHNNTKHKPKGQR